MKTPRLGCLVFVLGWSSGALAQAPQVEPQIVRHAEREGRVTVVEVAAHFVTTIRVPEIVNSVVVGDPAKFQVEHSEREPRLVFIKAMTIKPAQTNLLISTATGHQTSLLLVSRGELNSVEPVKVDFLVKYEPAGGFLVEPAGYPFAMVGETISQAQAGVNRGSANGTPLGAVAGAGFTPVTGTGSRGTDGAAPGIDAKSDELDQLLERQRRALLPVLYGEHVTEEKSGRDPIRAGVSEVIDGGQRVIVLFSVVNPTKHAVLLMPPQVQLGGKTKSGKLIRHSRWSTADQLPVVDFRLSRRRLGPGERVDGVVLFERPPYKQSNETLLLQVAESGAVDRPALAPIGFGVSTSWEGKDARGE